jgi:hypothetical protein
MTRCQRHLCGLTETMIFVWVILVVGMVSDAIKVIEVVAN